jgi:hypothetical protein
VGDSGGRDCFNQGDGTYYSARYWDSAEKMFLDQAGPRYKGDWHFIECCFKMNSIINGIGVADGVIQYRYDGKLTIDLHHILFRTGKYPDMKFNQFLIAPYIGDGSPVDQYLWVDNLSVTTTRPADGIRNDPAHFYLSNSNFAVRALTGNRIEIAARGAGLHDVSIQITNAAGRSAWRSYFKEVKEKTIIQLSPALSPGLYFIVARQAAGRPLRQLIFLRPSSLIFSGCLAAF